MLGRNGTATAVKLVVNEAESRVLFLGNYTMPPTMLADVAKGIGHIAINNPEKRNALSAEMSERGAEIINAFTTDHAVRVIVIASTGNKAWMSGADLRDFDVRDAGGKRPVNGFAFYDAVRSSAKPVVASIQGYCLGGGVALACACDLRIAATDAVFGIPVSQLGGSYPPHFTRWIVEVVGMPHAKEMLYSARRYGAEDALRMNLVNRLVAPGQLVQFTQEYAQALAANAPLSLRASKALVEEVAAKPTGWDEDYCRVFTEQCRTSLDFKEGRLAFTEGRKPAFLGK
jgi:enoyl-CoA hydratase/carnithine racemase